MKVRSLLTACATAACALQSSYAPAQRFPTKPIRFIVPYVPGGSANTLARSVALEMTETFGQQVVVDNRPGANGQIGMEMVAKSAPDGYTIVLAYISNVVIDPVINDKLPFDPIKDFVPITQLSSNSNVFVVHASVPARNVKELIAYAKANPNKLTFSSSSLGSVGHLTGELLNRLAGIDMVHIQYKGSGQAVIDVLSGQVQAMISGFSSTLPHIRTGKVRALAVTSSKRAAELPDVPTIAESGFPGFEATAWHGILAPAGTPKAAVNALNDAAVRGLAARDVKERLEALGFDIVASSPQQFAAFISSEREKWTPVVKASGLKAAN